MKDQKTTSSIRRNYDDEFKRNALKMVENGQSVRSVAAALGISESLLHAWRRKSHSFVLDCARSNSNEIS